VRGAYSTVHTVQYSTYSTVQYSTVQGHLGGEGAGGVGLDAAHHAQVVQTQE